MQYLHIFMGTKIHLCGSKYNCQSVGDVNRPVRLNVLEYIFCILLIAHLRLLSSGKKEVEIGFTLR